MVWVIGLEPTASASRTLRATNCAIPRYKSILPLKNTIFKFGIEKYLKLSYNN